MPKFKFTISFDYEINDKAVDYYKSNDAVSHYAQDGINLIGLSTRERIGKIFETDCNNGDIMVDEYVQGAIKVEKVEIVDGD